MAQEHDKEPAELTHIGLDLTTGVVSLFGTRAEGTIRFRFFLPPRLQQLLMTQPLTEQAVRTLLSTEQHEPSVAPAMDSERSAAFYRSAAVDGTTADLIRGQRAAQPPAPTAQEKNPTLVIP